MEFIESIVRDLRFALRQSRRQRGFTLAVVSTLALTIAANTTVFSVVDAVLIRALPFAAPDRLAWVTSVRSDNPEAPFSLPEYMDYREQTRSLAAVAAYANWSANMVGEGVTERFQGARVSANAFDVLGVSASAGRLLRDSDDRADAPPVAVLSHRVWQRQFGGAPDVVGRSVRINGESFVVVGILPARFPLPLRDIDVVVPLAPSRDPLRYERSSVNFLRLFGRLTPGVTMAQAQSELSTICAALRRQFPAEYARKEAVRTRPLQDALIGDMRPVLFFLLASVLIVLSVALANLLSLMLVRTVDRGAEMSVRMALGASRYPLIRQLTMEALVLTFVSGALGFALAVWATRLAVAVAPSSIPRLDEVRVDGRGLLFALVLTLVATLLLSAAPIAAVMRRRALEGLSLSKRGVVGDRWNHRVRNVLVLGEISTALVLLLATTLLVQSLMRLQRVHPGFRPGGVFQARLSLPPTYRSPDELTRFYEELSARLAGLPGVRSVGSISVAPLSGLLYSVPFTVAGQPPRTERELPSANLRIITPGYLSTVGTRLVRGRTFSASDRSNTMPVALVSEALAEKFLGQEPLGHRLLIDDNNEGPRPVEVVGVIENVRQDALDGLPTSDIYIPLSQVHPDGVSALRNNQFWMIRTETDPAVFREPFLTQLRAVNQDVGISSTGTMDQFLASWLAPRRFTLGLFTAFSLTAVLLAVGGVYGLVSYSVSQRRRELGLRVALGATARDVQKLILGQAAGLGLAGAALGLGVALVAHPLIARFAKNISLDPAAMLATTVVLCAAVALAGWLPARRAANVQPTLVLKGD